MKSNSSNNSDGCTYGMEYRCCEYPRHSSHVFCVDITRRSVFSAITRCFIFGFMFCVQINKSTRFLNTVSVFNTEQIYWLDRSVTRLVRRIFYDKNLICVLFFKKLNNTSFVRWTIWLKKKKECFLWMFLSTKNSDSFSGTNLVDFELDNVFVDRRESEEECLIEFFLYSIEKCDLNAKICFW